MPFPCPSCGKENADDAKACAYCPESFPDEDDELRKPKFKKIDPGAWSIKRWLLIFMLIGFAIWRAFAFLAMTLEKGALPVMGRYVKSKASVDEILNQDQSKNGLSKAMEIVLGTAPPTALAAAHEMRMSTKNGSISPTGRMGDSASKGEAVDDGPKWLLKGTVYDLVTLRPVRDCALTFAAGGKRFNETTDGSGQYSVAVPIVDHGGYDVVIKHNAYARTYLNPAAEHVTSMSLEDRKDMAHDLNQASEGPYQVQPIEDAPLTTDFYIAPKKY